MENKSKIMNKKGATGLRPWILSLVALLMFSIFIFNFAGLFIQARNPTSNILTYNNNSINRTINSLNNQLSQFSATVCTGGNCSNSTLYGQLKDTTPSPTDYLFLIFRGAFYIPLTLLSTAFGGLIAIEIMMLNSLGGCSDGGSCTQGGLGAILLFAINIIASGIIFTTIFLIIKNIRTGESER